jgi:chromosome segregation ATPase
MGENRSQTSRQRVTVAQASEILGITVEAVRGRIKRRTLKHERDSGTVYVLLDAGQTTDQPQPDDDQPTDQLRPDAQLGYSEELAEELRDRIHYLERQVEEEREARRRADTLLAQLMQRIPELEAPSERSEARESPETVEAEQELGTERTRREMAESTLKEGMAEERRRREQAERERDGLRQELYARREPRESPQTAEEASEGTEPGSYAPAPHSEAEAAQRPQGGGLRGLRRRLLGW